MMNAGRYAAGLVALALVSTNVSATGLSLSELALPTDATYGPYNSTSGYAITPDGRYVVGQARGGTGAFAKKGVLWDGQSGAVISWLLSSDGGGAENAGGVGYRVVDGQQQLVAVGPTSSGVNLYASLDNGATWGTKNRLLTSTYGSQGFGTANILGASGVDDSLYFGFSWSNGNQLSLVRGAGGAASEYKPALTVSTKGLTNPDTGVVRGVSGAGLAVGVRAGKNYKLVWNGTGTPSASYFVGLDGTQAGEAWAVSNDGLKVFGRSPVSGRTGTYPYMYDLVNPPVELPGLTGATGYASNGVVYGANADGRFAVGMSYPGAEKAVLWDTQVGGPPLDLTQYFTDAGLLGNFVGLSRAYSVGVDESGTIWITGEGPWTEDHVTTFTRGWVGAVTLEPVGACLEMGYGFRQCRVTSASGCTAADPTHTVTWTAGASCANQDCAVPFADTDSDGDVDQVDFSFFQVCFTGEVPPVTPLPACACLDRVKNELINEEDLQAFLKCVTGPAIPYSVALPGDCVPGDGGRP